RWRLVVGDRNGKDSGDIAVARPAVVDVDGDGGHAGGIGYRREGQGAGGVRGDVIDRRIGNQTRVAGNRSDGECLISVGRAGGDAGQVHGLQSGIFVDGQV